MRKKRTNKPVTKLKKELWRVFSHFIRLRDKGVCISCGKKGHWKEQNAGHFIHNVLDFDEMNINCQCIRCNFHLHGNGVGYTISLIKKHGLKKVEDLRLRASTALKGEKQEPEWYIKKIEHYKKKVAKLLIEYELFEN